MYRLVTIYEIIVSKSAGFINTQNKFNVIIHFFKEKNS